MRVGRSGSTTAPAITTAMATGGMDREFVRYLVAAPGLIVDMEDPQLCLVPASHLTPAVQGMRSRLLLVYRVM